MNYFKNLSLVNISEYIDGQLIVEKQKRINGYDYLYEISTFGRVKSLNGNNPKIRKAYFCKGYLYVDLYKNNVRAKFKIHRLVGMAFIKNPNNKPEINHKWGKKTDNRVSELEWVTGSENKKHAYGIGLSKPFMLGRKGKLCHRSRRVVQYSLDGEFIKSFDSMTDVEQELEVSGISSVCLGRRPHAGGFRWFFEGEVDLSKSVFIHERKVVQFDVAGRKIGEFESISAAARSSKIQASGISTCCRGRNSTAGGFMW